MASRRLLSTLLSSSSPRSSSFSSPLLLSKLSPSSSSSVVAPLSFSTTRSISGNTYFTGSSNSKSRNSYAFWGATIAAIASPLLIYGFKNAYCSTNNDYVETVVGKVTDLKNGEMKEVKVGENKILLSRVNGEFFATDSKCTHFGAPLQTGVLVGDRVTCPWHAATFNVRTGSLEVDGGPAMNSLNTYEVKIKGDDIIVVAPLKAPPSKTPEGNRGCGCHDNRVFVVVGSGAAGAVAAETLRQDGFKGRLILVTQDQNLPYDRTSLSKGVGTPVQKLLLRDEQFYKTHDIEVHRGRKVESVDFNNSTLVFEDGSNLKFDSVLLAPGAKPRTLPVPGSGLFNIIPLRNYEDIQAIEQAAKNAKKVVIVGASFIGTEVASTIKKSFPNVGSVTIIGMEKVPLERVLGDKVGAAVQKLHEDNGISFKLSHTVKEFVGTDKVQSLILDNGDHLEADLVIMGVGVIPNTDFIRGVEKNRDGSISVDEYLRVPNTKNVFAAGDIASFPYQGDNIRVEHWAVAQNQGRVAAHNMVGQHVKHNSVPFFWTRAWDNSLQYAGHAKTFDDVIIQGDLTKRTFTALYVRNNEIVAVASMGVPKVAAAATELLRLKQMPSPSEFKKGNVDLVARLKQISSN